MPLKIKSSYEALLYFIEDIDIINVICQHFYNKDSFFDFQNKDSQLWQVLLSKINDNRHHHYTNRKSLDFLQYKLSLDSNRHTLYNLLKYLYLEHFDLKRGRNILRIDRIESFQFLQNSIDIIPIYAMAISEYTEEENYTSSEKIQYLTKSLEYNNIPLPNRFLSIENFSDNHFHLGGGNNYSYRLHKMLQDPLIVNAQTSPKNNKLSNFTNPNQRKFIVYATSILEQLLLGYIVNNNNDVKSSQDILNNRKLFRDALRTFSRAIQNTDFHLLDSLINSEKTETKKTYKHQNIDELTEGNEKTKSQHNLFFDIRPKLHRNFFDSLLTDNYYNELIYHIIIYNIHNEIHKADIMLWVLFSDIARNHKDKVLKDFILVYMSLRNILHSFIVQDQKSGGLEYFSSYSRSTLRRAKEDYELIDTFRSILDKKYNFFIEGRIIFQDNEELIAQEIAKWFKSFIEANLEIGNPKNKIKFMMHYKKGVDSLSKKFIDKTIKGFLPIRYEEYRKSIFKETQTLLNFFKNKRFSQYKIALNIEKFLNELQGENKAIIAMIEAKHQKFLNELQKENRAIIAINKKEKYIVVNLHHLISGIDAASLEYNTPPEVFAPVYNYVKHSPLLLNKFFQFSFHAGEDTEDIVTSLRTVVETIIFLDLKKGDRLGHALSLGFMQDKMQLEDNIILISREKAFDNAVFLYCLFYSLYNQTDRHKYLNIFEQKILNLGSKIYTKNFTIDQYVNAWLLRRNSPLIINQIFDEKYSEYQKKYQQDNQSSKRLKKRTKNKFVNFLQNSDIKTYHKYQHLYPYKLFFKYATQDLFKLKNRIDTFYTQRYETARNDVNAWKIFLKYHFNKNVRRQGNEQIEDSLYRPDIIEMAQDLIMEHIIAKNDLIIEVMPTSNLLNSEINAYTKHPLFRFKPVDNNEPTAQ